MPPFLFACSTLHAAIVHIPVPVPLGHPPLKAFLSPSLLQASMSQQGTKGVWIAPCKAEFLP